MRKILFKTLLFLFVSISSILAAKTQNVTVTIPNIDTSAGKDISLEIQVSDLTGLQVFSVDFSLAFDTNLLQALQVTNSGTISAFWGNPTVNISSGQVVVSLAGVDPLVRSGALVRIKFHVSDNASTGDSSDLLFLNFKFNDGQPQAITQNGTFTVTGDFDPPQIVSGPSIIEKDYFNAKIRIETDEPSAVLVLYGETTFYGQIVTDANFSFSHTLSLTNLRETTNYYYQIQLTDSLNNGPNVTSGYTFSTKNVTLNLPNIIVDPGANIQIPVTIPDFSDLNVNKLSLEILFDQAQIQVSGINTNETVLSGWQAPQMSILPGKVSVIAEHTTALQGGGTLFFFSGKIPATALVNQTSSLSFANVVLNDGQIKLITNNGSITVEDRLPPQIISGPSVFDVGSNSATVQWQTNEPATSLIEYGKSTAYDYARQKETFKTDHNFVLTNLDPGVTYHFRVGGKDVNNNGPNWSQDATFSTIGTDVSVGFPDTTVDAGSTVWIPLVTSNISEYSVTNWHALVGYNSNKLRLIDFKQENTLISTWNPVEVDSTSGFISISAHGSAEINGAGHLILLGFKINENIQNNQISEIALLNFRYDESWPAVASYNSTVHIIGGADLLAPEILWGPFVDKISNSSARIFWRTNELSFAEIEYGLTQNYDNSSSTNKLDTLHQIILTGLQPDIQYHYHIRNRDLADNVSSFSADSIFQTLAGNSIAVSIPTRSANPGETIDVPIQTGNVAGLEVYSSDIEIIYDETLLSAISAISDGCLSSTWGSPVYTLLPGRVVIAMGGIQALQSSGDLVKVRFRVLNSAPANDLAIIHFNSFIFNEGSPLSSYSFGAIRINDNIPPKLIAGPAVMDIQANSATIAWQTDKAANSRVHFGIDSPEENILSKDILQNYHALLLDGLLPNTTYKYRIASKDSLGNDWISSQVYQFNTSSINQLIFTIEDLEADRDQDIFFSLRQEGSSSRPIFSMDFDLFYNADVLEFKDILITAEKISGWSREYQEISQGNIHFHFQGAQPVSQNGELLKFLFFTKQSAYGVSSSIEMNNLLVNGTSSNISITNGLFRLVDRTLPVFVAEPIISQLRATSANISWITDEATTGLIVYNKLGSNQDTVKISTLSTETSYTLTGLSSTSFYQIKAGITDSIGNGPVWSDLQEFSTTSGNEVEVLLPDTSVAIGDTVMLPILLKSVPGIPINKYQFKLVFDANLLGFQKTNQLITLTESWQTAITTIRDDSLILSHSAGQAISQIGTLVKLQFVVRKQARHEQQIPLRFFSFVFNDGAPPASITNGSIHCIDTSPPIFINSPVVAETHPRSVILKVETDEPTKLTINYGQEAAMGTILEISKLDTLHQISIEELLPNQTYYFQVQVLDSLNNGPTISEILFFKTTQQIVYVSIPDTTLTIGSDFQLPVLVSDVTDLNIQQYSLEINYDFQSLTPLGISIDSSLTSMWGNGTFSSDNQKIIFSNSGSLELQGSGVLAWLKFNTSSAVNVTDSTELIISQAIFQNGSVPATAKNGRIRFVKQDSADIKVSLPDTLVYPDSQFKVALRISDVFASNIYSYSFVLLFDNTILGLNKIETDNTLTENWQIPVSISSGDSLKISHLGAEPLFGAGNLLIFHFNVIPGVSVGSRSDLKILDFLVNNNLPITKMTNGSVTIVEIANKIVGYTKNKHAPFKTISSASVYAMDSNNLIVSASMSDSSGYFEIPNLDLNSLYKITAIKTGYSPSDTLAGIYPSYQPIDLYMLALDGIIYGAITDIKKNPVAQAVLSVNNRHGFISSASSDLNGEFQIQKLDRRFPYQLSITKYGFENKSLNNIYIENNDTTLTIVLDWKYGTITGSTVSFQNEPISDVKIIIYYQDSGEQFTEIQTNADGYFHADSLPANSYIVVAQKTGFLSRPKQHTINLAPEEEKQIKFQLKTFQLVSIKITGESFSIPNDAPTQFSYTALSDSGETIDQIENLEWVLRPEAAGHVLNGLVYLDSLYIGAASLTLNESNFGISDTSTLFIYANINPDLSYQLYDDEGMELILPQGAASTPFQLKFDITILQSIKGATRSHMLIGKGYDFIPAGFELLQPALLRLPIPESHSGQNLNIGYWEPTRAEWHVLADSRLIGLDKIETEIEKFSLFALLSPSTPLGVHNLKFTPNPFSPQVDSDGDGLLGVNISFYVTSKTIRQPFVTIKIYSLYGELIRNLIIDNPLDKGKVHSFNWDGKTEMDRMARNGRYLVQIEVKDQKETKNYLNQVVLIK
jgi:hypothetical protein